MKNGPDIFDLRGIGRDNGAIVIVRPDQYVFGRSTAGRAPGTHRFLRTIPVESPLALAK
jgi:hypothetical protein